MRSKGVYGAGYAEGALDGVEGEQVESGGLERAWEDQPVSRSMQHWLNIE